jgi:hypothetical protein
MGQRGQRLARRATGHPLAAGLASGLPAMGGWAAPDRLAASGPFCAPFRAAVPRLAAGRTAWGVDPVARQSTGVSWRPIVESGQARGLKV